MHDITGYLKELSDLRSHRSPNSSGSSASSTKRLPGIATAKANAEKNLQNARALFESHLQSVFTQRGKGWVERDAGNSLGARMD